MVEIVELDMAAKTIRERMNEVESHVRKKSKGKKPEYEWQLKNRIREGLKKELVVLGILDGKLWP